MGEAGRTLVLASGNAGKLRELASMLAPLGFVLRAQSDWAVPEADEDGITFIENALKKARHASAHTGLPAVADDSGLVVPALGGAPGVRSARFAGPGASDADNNRKLLAEMSGFDGAQRAACFHCTMVLLRSPDDPMPAMATASWWGAIAQSPAGSGGFGYDPLFWLAERRCSAAELSPAIKNRLSHRGQAARALVEQLHRGQPSDD
jgi:XTP/dITP diphosphohydrolase